MENLQSTGSFQLNKRELAIICISGALAVSLGAFGAHALEGKLSVERAETFATANFYHFVHTVVLLIVLCLKGISKETKSLNRSLLAFGWGHILFSGSLYVLATRGLIGLEGWGWLGAITPFGGLCFIAGWIFLAFSFR